jgi:type II restriction/modification system DNA methylase subunit YeeA
MNKAKLKTYAPQARKDFIAAVVARANLLGISEKNGKLQISPSEKKGDVTLIAGQAWPAKVHEQRDRLIKRMQKVSAGTQSAGFGETAEAIAYTWFNRFAALRYMEIHDYLGHGHRVLSSREGGLPEILTHATELAGVLPGLNAAQIADMKMAGNKDGELYRMLLVAQCNALSSAMPFLFERVDDESELLLPDNLIRTDSLIRSLVDEIPEADWARIEIVGWLYQFYISEKKDQVIGKVVATEDIPAATQLFTPNWIVKYMVQNSLGAQWLATYPQSQLKGQMEYYIEPAEQTDEVKAQLAAITPSTLNPEELTLIDPACGSGHILVEAYEIFKAIYLERGYRQRDVARLILEKNLFGLDIDERAAQLTGFALTMKGRADDRRLFECGVKLNVMALVDSAGFDVEALAQGMKLADYGLKTSGLTELKQLFEHATTFGSLIQVSEGLASQLPELKQLSDATSHDLFVSDTLERLGPLVRQAELLAAQYDAVVANPPYMGSGGMNGPLRKFAKDNFAESKDDLFACFIERGCIFANDLGSNAMITMHSWMFLSSFEMMRKRMLREKIIRTMAHFGARAFGSISGEVVQTTAFVLGNRQLPGFKPVFLRLLDGGEDQKRSALADGKIRFDAMAQDDFKTIPGNPIAYWASAQMRRAFADGEPLRVIAEARRGVETGDNGKFLRQWQEVSMQTVGLNCEVSTMERTWYPYNKGGGFRKWYGNRELVINWRDNGHDIKNQAYPKGGRLPWRAANEDSYFRDGLTWGGLTSGDVTFRFCDYGAVFDSNKGSMMFPTKVEQLGILALLNSKVVAQFLSILNPTISTQKDDIGNIALIRLHYAIQCCIDEGAAACVGAAKSDENSYERSWDFQSLPILTASPDPSPTLESSYAAWITQSRHAIAEMKRLEEENNRLFIDAYGLADELTPEVPLSQITLTVNPAYRYAGNLSEEEQWTHFRQDTMEELVSYAIGCMMGRYSLDEPGLIYAHAGNVGFDATRYKTFPADADGILPITDELWFEDDAAKRIREFILAVWPESTFQENMAWLAESLGTKANETPDETIRRYLSSSFFKDHLQTYKKRPIYWLFSSGKQGAFQALVYLHRYHEGTLARMRAEYVVPLTGKMQSRIEMLGKDRDAATSTAARNRIARQIESLKKKHVELLAYDEKLRHYADRRITLDLDDGVKVNYGKFGDLLAEVKAVTGGATDE